MFQADSFDVLVFGGILVVLALTFIMENREERRDVRRLLAEHRCPKCQEREEK